MYLTVFEYREPIKIVYLYAAPFCCLAELSITHSMHTLVLEPLALFAAMTWCTSNFRAEVLISLHALICACKAGEGFLEVAS